MLATYFNITVSAEWCAFIAAILLLGKKTGIWQLFIPLLFLTLCVETAGWYQTYIQKKTNNSWPFNFLMIISISFFAWLLANAAPMKKARNIIYITVVIFIVIGLSNLFFLQGFLIYDYITEVFGDVIIMTTCCYFFYAVLKEDTYRNLFKYEYFWLAIGLLFSSLGSAILYIFLNALQDFRKKTHINVFGYFNYAINLLLYVSLIISFVCRKNKRLL